MKQLNKLGHLVVGVIAGVVIALLLNFFSTHHVVVEKDNCRWSDEASAMMCDFHYEGNK